jgi:lipoprotein-anchoring transpeptidase ErfK/SrfK
MKNVFILSALLAGGSMLFNSSSHKSESNHIPSYKVSKWRKTSSLPIAPVKIVVDKSDYELTVFDAQGWYATYPVVFGNGSLADKKMEGDRNTPEGTFKIVSKRLHNKWDRYMGLDYPTQESIDKFNEWKRRGMVPSWASPGGGIGIHGTFPHEDFVVDRYKNWTNGCISLKRGDVEELYSYIQVGTPVTIKR